MALINCPQCNHTVSDKSKKCINCGCEIKKKPINKKVIITFICSVLAFIVLLFTVTLITSQVGIKQYFSLIDHRIVNEVLRPYETMRYDDEWRSILEQHLRERPVMFNREYLCVFDTVDNSDIDYPEVSEAEFLKLLNTYSRL